jgi:hypothetical protein
MPAVVADDGLVSEFLAGVEREDYFGMFLSYCDSVSLLLRWCRLVDHPVAGEAD